MEDSKNKNRNKKLYLILGGLIIVAIIAGFFVVFNIINAPIPVPDVDGIITEASKLSNVDELTNYCNKLERSANSNDEYQNIYRGCSISFVRKGATEESLPWLQKVDESLITDKLELSNHYTFLYSAYYAINDTENAQKYFDKAYEIREELNLNIGG